MPARAGRRRIVGPADRREQERRVLRDERQSSPCRWTSGGSISRDCGDRLPDGRSGADTPRERIEDQQREAGARAWDGPPCPESTRRLARRGKGISDAASARGTGHDRLVGHAVLRVRELRALGADRVEVVARVRRARRTPCRSRPTPRTRAGSPSGRCPCRPVAQIDERRHRHLGQRPLERRVRRRGPTTSTASRARVIARASPSP